MAVAKKKTWNRDARYRCMSSRVAERCVEGRGRVRAVSDRCRKGRQKHGNRDVR
jgi:hypothetical protein